MNIIIPFCNLYFLVIGINVKMVYLNRLYCRKEVKEGSLFGLLSWLVEDREILSIWDLFHEPCLRLPRSRVRLPTHSCGAAFFHGGTERITLPFLGLFLLVSIFPTSLSVFPGTRPRAGVTPIIWSLNLRYRDPWSGLVAKSPIMSPVGHHTTDTSYFSTPWVIKKYRMLMCFVRLLI
jgi:hypothetical protein